MSTFRDDIQHAIELMGSQSKLATELGCTQQAISFLLSDRCKNISAEMAAKIDRATGGQVSKEKLRPDVFGLPVRQDAPENAGAAA
jgi:DNA-binding transcriptional regulator YdaS (Cro superfamily)